MTKSEKTRKFIIETTAPIFNKKGFAGTSLSDLTEATDLTKGSIYGNFSGKDDVAIEAFFYNYNKLKNAISEELEEKKNAVKKLLVYSDFYRKNHKEIFDSGGCPMINTAIESDDTHDFLAQNASEALKEFEAGLKKIIEKGIKNKEIKEIDSKKYASQLIVIIEGGMFLSKATGKAHFINNALDLFDQIVLNELKA